MHDHPLAKHGVRNAWMAIGLGLFITGWAACGYPAGRGLLRAPGHSPFAFDEYGVLDALGVATGLVVLAFWCPRLIGRLRQLEQIQETQSAHFFARAGAPRSIHELLLGVAAHDGSIGQAERDVVTRLLTRELPERVLPHDLKNWATAMRQPRDPVAVARSLTGLLSRAERRTVMTWCREVAGADLRIGEDESALLRRLREVLEDHRDP